MQLAESTCLTWIWSENSLFDHRSRFMNRVQDMQKQAFRITYELGSAFEQVAYSVRPSLDCECPV